MPKKRLDRQNMKRSRADLLREKEESYEDFFGKNQLDKMAELEEQLVIQLRVLVEENSELEKETSALEPSASHT